MSLIRVVFAATAPADERDHAAGRDVEGDVRQDIGRFRSAILETHPAQLDPSFQAVHGRETRTIAALLRFLFKDVVQPIEQHVGELQVVPHA